MAAQPIGWNPKRNAPPPLIRLKPLAAGESTRMQIRALEIKLAGQCLVDVDRAFLGIPRPDADWRGAIGNWLEWPKRWDEMIRQAREWFAERSAPDSPEEQHEALTEFCNVVRAAVHQPRQRKSILVSRAPLPAVLRNDVLKMLVDVGRAAGIACWDRRLTKSLMEHVFPSPGNVPTHGEFIDWCRLAQRVLQVRPAAKHGNQIREIEARLRGYQETEFPCTGKQFIVTAPPEIWMGLALPVLQRIHTFEASQGTWQWGDSVLQDWGELPLWWAHGVVEAALLFRCAWTCSESEMEYPRPDNEFWAEWLHHRGTPAPTPGALVGRAWWLMRQMAGRNRPDMPDRYKSPRTAIVALDHVIRWCERQLQKAVIPPAKVNSKRSSDAPASSPPVKEKTPRLSVEPGVLIVDGEPIPFNGGPKTKQRVEAFARALIDAGGGMVSMSQHHLRSRDLKAQHRVVQEWLWQEASPGAGCYIPRDKLGLS